MKTTVGSMVHPWYKGNHEWQVKGIAELNQPIQWDDPVQGKVSYEPKIMELEGEGVGKVLWFNYWILTSKTGEKTEWGGGPPMLEESVILELIREAMKKGLFTKGFVAELHREVQLALE